MGFELLGVSFNFSWLQIIGTGFMILCIVVGAIGTSVIKKNKGENENKRLAKEMEEEYRRRQYDQEDDDELERLISNDYND